jgi:hypothetical protein
LYVIPSRTSSALTIRRVSFFQFMGCNILQTNYCQIRISLHEHHISHIRLSWKVVAKQGRGLSFGFYTIQDKSKLIRSRSAYV